MITGPSSGIGRDLAYLFARDGANLVLVSRRQEKLEVLKRELEGRHGIEAHLIPKDLSLRRSAEEIVQECAKRNLAIDILVNNAGFGIYGPFHEGRIQDYLGMIELHVGTLLVLTHAFLPAMIRRRKGGILNVASTAGFQPLPYLNVYAATKAFMVHFTLALAQEVRDSGVRVTCLCPGSTETEFFENPLMKGLFPPRLGRMSSKKVAELGYTAFRRGRCLCIPALKNRFQVGLVRLLPMVPISKVVHRIMSRPSPYL